ncbi:MAG: hypothetical protein JWQ03_3132 [Variovorax sp.]|nr:hypothetical protein [Variovorax sp.]
MEMLIVFFAVFMLAAPMAYRAGQWSREYPSEEEMFDRLVSARSARKVRQITKGELEGEIETASNDLVGATRS